MIKITARNKREVWVKVRKTPAKDKMLCLRYSPKTSKMEFLPYLCSVLLKKKDTDDYRKDSKYKWIDSSLLPSVLISWRQPTKTIFDNAVKRLIKRIEMYKRQGKIN